jgi:hypothetical protein
MRSGPASLLAKPKIVRWLERHHADSLTEFLAIIAISTLSEAPADATDSMH